MGNNRINRFKSASECSSYLKKIGITNIECLNYGGKFKEKSIFRCLTCQYIWETTLDALVHRCGCGCPQCSKVARINNINEVNEWLKQNSPNISCVYYAGSCANKESKFECLNDGYQWTTSFNNIRNNKRGCAQCVNLKKNKGH